MAWNRKKVIEFCNTEIFPKVDHRAWSYVGGELQDVVKMVIKFRREHGYPEIMIAEVDDGFLTINGTAVGRIARKLRNQQRWINGADYWEGRILARQESSGYYD